MNKTIVLIPHYNNTNGLQKSIESINSKEKVDILIVDDGSQNEVINELLINKSFKAKGQIFFLYLTINKGIEHTLNFGLDYILKQNKYFYIARLDCGDLCIGKRFKIQEEYLNKNPKIKLLGTHVNCVDELGNFLYTLKMPITLNDVKNKMYLNCMLVHPSVMFTTEVVKKIGKYPTNYKYAEDYAYFFKIIKKYNAVNLNETLVQIEINPKGISIQKRKEQVKSRISIIKKYFYFGYYPIYGLIRSYILLYIPFKLILKLKKLNH